MAHLSLPLRQRQLLNYLQHSKGYTTGAELSKQLNVSSRTIRNDISEINKQLAEFHIQITSKHSFGYLIEADDAKQLQALTRTEESFLSRTERLRHIAYRLALSDAPINLDELADEMYISKTTLEHDLKEFRHEFILPQPHIQMFRSKNSISFEHDERKRRKILCHLYSSSWNYHARGNTFFHYRYLDEKIVNTCIQEANFYLDKYHIMMEDTNMVHLDLIIAIAAKRIQEGHELATSSEHYYILPEAVTAVDDLLNSIESKLHCRFSRNERKDIYQLISCSILPDPDHIKDINVQEFFLPSLIRFAEHYLSYLKEEYGFDLRTDRDFYISFLIFLRYLHMPVHYLNDVGISKEQAQLNNAIELEVAFRIQPMALSYYGNYLDFTELLYLSFLLKGAIIRVLHPKLRTALLCHYNLPIAWKLRSEIELRFPNDLTIDHLMPMYRKDNFDFNDIDLILTTTDKRNFSREEIETIRISPYFTETDEHNITRYIQRTHFRKLYRKEFPDLTTLLNEANWHENLTDLTYFQLLDFLGNELIQMQLVTEDYLTDIFRREQMMTFASHAPFILVYSSVPAQRTQIEIATLKHRISVNGKKIRTVIMLCMRSTDRGLIFKFINELYNSVLNPEDARFLKTKEEFIRFIAQINTP